jgi:hypothetical protein
MTQFNPRLAALHIAEATPLCGDDGASKRWPWPKALLFMALAALAGWAPFGLILWWGAR